MITRSRKFAFGEIPLEIVEIIFGYLSPKDIKRGVLVCRIWRDILSKRKFWNWAEIKLAYRNMKKIVRSPRFQLVGRVDLDIEREDPCYLIGNDKTLASVFSAFSSTSQICKGKQMRFFFEDFPQEHIRNIKPEDLADVMPELIYAYVRGAELFSPHQRNLVFDRVANSEAPKLFRFKYIAKSMYNDSDILTVARAVSRICIVDLVVKFTKEELFTLLTFIVEASDTMRLRILRLHFYNSRQFFDFKSDPKWRDLLAKVKGKLVDFV